jgi:hypothetical protein
VISKPACANYLDQKNFVLTKFLDFFVAIAALLSTPLQSFLLCNMSSPVNENNVEHCMQLTDEFNHQQLLRDHEGLATFISQQEATVE